MNKTFEKAVKRKAKLFMKCVSIIVPVYNSEKFINRCVKSILNQTFKNFELLLIDDGSSDNSGVICDEYADKDNRIRVLHKENTGVSDTRNVGLKEAKGDYILFVDSDDYIKSNMLEKLTERAIKYGSDIVMCNYVIEKDGNKVVADMKYDEVYDGSDRVKNGLLYLYYTDKHIGLYSLCNKLIKKTIYSTNCTLFDTSLKRGEDAWFIFQCLENCCRVDFIPEAFYYYCQNDNSIMHKTYDDQYEQWVYTRKRLLRQNEKFGFNIDYAIFYKEFLYKVAIFCKEEFGIGNISVVKKLFRDEFYLKAAKYTKYLPLHIKVLHKCARISPVLAIMVIRIWSKKKV